CPVNRCQPCFFLTWLQRGVAPYRVVVNLELVRDGQDQVVVVQVAEDLTADGLRVELRRRRGWRGATCATGRLRHTKLVRQHGAGVSGLRVGANVRERASDIHVQILEELRPLRHQHVAATFCLKKLESRYPATIHETRIPVGGGNRIRRRCRTIVTPLAAAAHRQRWQVVEIESDLLCLDLYVRIERRGIFDIESAAATETGYRRTRSDGHWLHSQFLQFVHQFLWRLVVHTDAKRTEIDASIELERHRHRGRILLIHAVNHVEHHRSVFARTHDGSHAILRPSEHHAAVTTDAAERRTKRTQATADRRRYDRARCLCADPECNTARR